MRVPKNESAPAVTPPPDIDWAHVERVLQQMASLQRFVGISETARLLDTSVASVRRYIKSGDIPAPIRLGTRRLAAAGPDKNGRPRRTQLHRWWLPELVQALRSEPRGWEEHE